jgi:hypothetical protein
VTSLWTGRSVNWSSFPAVGSCFLSISPSLTLAPTERSVLFFVPWAVLHQLKWPKREPEHCLLRSTEDVYAPCCCPFTAAYVFMIWYLFIKTDSVSFVKWTAGQRSLLVKSKEGILMTCRHALWFYKMILVLLCNFLLVVIKFRNNIYTWGVTLHLCIWNEYQIPFLFAKLCVHRGLEIKKNQTWKIII